MKAASFLGYRALRDLFGSIGRSSAGRYDTRHLSTGIETVAAPKPYEFGAVAKAYFTTPYTLGQYVLMDDVDRKTKTTH